LAAAIALLAAAPASAQGVSGVQIQGTTVTATVSLPGALAANLTLEFETASGLTASSLGLSAAAINPVSLASRLPAQVSEPAGFPVVVRVEPPALGGLGFDGVYHLSLHTSNLHYVADSPLRLYAAHGGGAFRDITDEIGSGSYRVRGTGGSFSEFVIVADLRSDASATGTKFDQLEDLLAAHSAALGAALEDLQGQLATARTAYEAGEIEDALTALDGFAASVGDAGLPDEWRASGGAANVSGLLRASAATLRFSLALDN
jgi:hypothetical protein